MFAIAPVLAAVPAVATRRIEKQMSLAPGQAVVVQHRYGNVAVVGSNDARVSVDALVRVTAEQKRDADEFARGVEIKAGAWADSLVFTTLYPEGEMAESRPGYQVDLNFHVPVPARVIVRSSFGDVSIAGMTGDCRVSNRFGAVEIDRCGRCDVENYYGAVRLIETRGLAVVRNAYGDVDLTRALGPVQVANRYGTVQTEESGGEVRIDNQFGNVIAHPDRGRLSIANRYGDVSAWIEDAELTAMSIMSRLGRVELNLSKDVPYQLDARAVQGRILSGLPFVVREVGTRQQASGRQGAGGPHIELHGVWSDFTIQGDTGELDESGPAGSGPLPASMEVR
jgi:hypothetical protein